jgi:hypothetical protein
VQYDDVVDAVLALLGRLLDFRAGAGTGFGSFGLFGFFLKVIFKTKSYAFLKNVTMYVHMYALFNVKMRKANSVLLFISIWSTCT